MPLSKGSGIPRWAVRGMSSGCCKYFGRQPCTGFFTAVSIWASAKKAMGDSHNRLAICDQRSAIYMSMEGRACILDDSAGAFPAASSAARSA